MDGPSPDTHPSENPLTYCERMQHIIDALETKYIASLKLEEISAPHINESSAINALLEQMKEMRERLMPGIMPDEYLIKVIEKQEKFLGITK